MLEIVFFVVLGLWAFSKAGNKIADKWFKK